MTKKAQSTPLREAARNKPCMIRSPVCNGDNATTVLCHVRMGIGIAQKAPDLCAAWGCFNCHQLVDGHDYFGQSWDAAKLRQMLLEGVIRTLIELDGVDAISIDRARLGALGDIYD